jgi:DNA invertase Pin-like site-specific DNA recombinase
MALYGYARVSTRDQDLAAQESELMAAGCAKIFKEKVSGAKTDLSAGARRAGLPVEPGDTLLVCRLDRLAAEPSVKLQKIEGVQEDPRPIALLA